MTSGVPEVGTNDAPGWFLPQVQYKHSAKLCDIEQTRNRLHDGLRNFKDMLELEKCYEGSVSGTASEFSSDSLLSW